MRPTRIAFLVIVLLSALAGLSRAAAPSIPAPAAPAGCPATGEMLHTAVPALPPGVEECELFLVPKGGAPIRVSPEGSADAREIRWRMPAVAARTARLVLRAGGEEGEWESPPSESFELAPLPASELALVLRGRSEAGVRLDSSAGASAAGLRAREEAPSLWPAAGDACAVEPSPASLAAPGDCGPVLRDGPSSRRIPAPATQLRSGVPAFRPLRN